MDIKVKMSVNTSNTTSILKEPDFSFMKNAKPLEKGWTSTTGGFNLQDFFNHFASDAKDILKQLEATAEEKQRFQGYISSLEGLSGKVANVTPLSILTDVRSIMGSVEAVAHLQQSFNDYCEENGLGPELTMEQKAGLFIQHDKAKGSNSEIAKFSASVPDIAKDIFNLHSVYPILLSQMSMPPIRSESDKQFVLLYVSYMNALSENWSKLNGGILVSTSISYTVTDKNTDGDKSDVAKNKYVAEKIKVAADMLNEMVTNYNLANAPRIDPAEAIKVEKPVAVVVRSKSKPNLQKIENNLNTIIENENKPKRNVLPQKTEPLARVSFFSTPFQYIASALGISNPAPAANTPELPSESKSNLSKNLEILKNFNEQLKRIPNEKKLEWANNEIKNLYESKEFKVIEREPEIVALKSDMEQLIFDLMDEELDNANQKILVIDKNLGIEAIKSVLQIEKDFKATIEPIQKSTIYSMELTRKPELTRMFEKLEKDKKIEEIVNALSEKLPRISSVSVHHDVSGMHHHNDSHHQIDDARKMKNFLESHYPKNPEPTCLKNLKSEMDKTFERVFRHASREIATLHGGHHEHSHHKINNAKMVKTLIDVYYGKDEKPEFLKILDKNIKDTEVRLFFHKHDLKHLVRRYNESKSVSMIQATARANDIVFIAAVFEKIANDKNKLHDEKILLLKTALDSIQENLVVSPTSIGVGELKTMLDCVIKDLDSEATYLRINMSDKNQSEGKNTMEADTQESENESKKDYSKADFVKYMAEGDNKKLLSFELAKKIQSGKKENPMLHGFAANMIKRQLSKIENLFSSSSKKNK